MSKEITIKLPYKVIVEIAKNLPLTELRKIERKLEKGKNQKVAIFKLSALPFFSHKPVNLGDTSVEDINRIIAKQI